MTARLCLVLTLAILPSLLGRPADAAVYVNRDYYWHSASQEWRYNIVDRHYSEAEPVLWEQDSDFGRQGVGPLYILEADVYVDDGATLSVSGGVTVQIPPGRGFYVRGTLNAEGSAEEKILFTSSQALPEPGSWTEILFIGQGASGSVMRHCQVRYGGSGVSLNKGGVQHNALGAVAAYDSAPTIDQCSVSFSANYGFYGFGPCEAEITNSAFLENEVGVALLGQSYAQEPGVQAPVRGNTISSNTSAGMCTPQSAGAFGSSNSVVGNLRNVIRVEGGSVQSSAQWRALTGAPVWQVSGNVFCGAGRQLSIGAGNVVKFDPAVSMYVGGQLTVAGTSGSRVYFTSIRDDFIGGDSNGDGSATQPAPGDWSEIMFHGAAAGASVMDYAEVRYGGSGRSTSFPGFLHNENGAIGFRDSAPTVRNTRVRWSKIHGLMVLRGSAPVLDRVDVNGCGQWAVWLENLTSNPVLSNCSATGSGTNGIRMPTGHLTDSRTWYASIPYVLDSFVFVDPGAALTIQPGTAVKVRSDGAMYVGGNLQALGTSLQPVYFTSLADDIHGDTNNDGGATAAAPGSWRGLDFYGQGASSSELTWCVVRYGGNGTADGSDGFLHNQLGSVYLRDCSPTFISTTFSHSGNYALYATRDSMPVLGGCTFRDSQWGIVTETGALAQSGQGTVVTGCTVTANARAMRLSPDALGSFAGNNIVSGNASNGIQIVGGSLNGSSVTWRRMQGQPAVHLTGNLFVPLGKTLNITAGNVLKMAKNCSIYVHGVLKAEGVSGNRVFFTSALDDTLDGDTNSDGAATSPAPGDWPSLVFSGAGSNSSLLKHCEIRYGAQPVFNTHPGYSLTHNGALIFRESAPSIQDCTVDLPQVHGAYVLEGARPVFLRVSFRRAGQYAVWQHIQGDGTYAECQATGNNRNGVFLSGGVMAENRTWWKSLPYIISSQIDVAAGSHLQVQPGAVIKLQSGGAIYCFGRLQAESVDPAQPIVFTSLKDDSAGGDTNNDGSLTSPAPGDWREIALIGAGASASHLRGCRVSYGADGTYTSAGGFNHSAFGNILVKDAAPLLEQSTISYSGRDGVHCLTGSAPRVTACTLENNVRNGIRMEDGFAAPAFMKLVRECTIRGNAGGAISCTPSASLVIGADNVIAGNTGDYVEVRSGTMEQSGEWEKLSQGAASYLIAGTVTVSPTAVLKVKPGAVVKFKTASWLGVLGSMDATGAFGNRIYFTSWRDDSVGGDTNADGAATQPEPGDYREILISGSGLTRTFSHCVFRYGGNMDYFSQSGFFHNADGNVYVREAYPTFQYCEFSFSGKHGAVFSDADGYCDTSTFAKNAQDGLLATGASDVIVTNSIFSANTRFGINEMTQQGSSVAVSYTDLHNSYYRYVQDDQNVWTAVSFLPSGTGCFSADPRFQNPAAGDFALQADSPCIDAGNPLRLDPDGTRLDVGAYPFLLDYLQARIGELPQHPDGTHVVLDAGVVTFASAGVFYLQQADRAAGIRVASDQVVQRGDLVSVAGTLTSDGAERLVQAAAVNVAGSSAAPRPLYMTGRTIGGAAGSAFVPGVAQGAGLYNVGLLVTTSGRVTVALPGEFWLDDGSGRVGAEGRAGVRVISDAFVAFGQRVRVTGISGAYSDSGTVRSVIRTRHAADVLPLQ